MSAPASKVDGLAPFERGNWVAESPEFDHPKIAKVRDVYYDSICKEWVADLILYSADGNRIGRESPRMGGPAGFEPCVPCADWRAVKKPNFPLEHDLTGYRDWKGSLRYVEPRHV